MVLLRGGRFWMGSDDPSIPEASPVHEVRVDPFWIDRTEVTNGQFAQFVRATGYRTVAERSAGADRGGLVFRPQASIVSLRDLNQWWQFVSGADWRHPRGPGSSIVGREREPVVQIAFTDAEALAHWAGKRLPTEAEYEFAARGGLDRKRFAWGDDFRPGGAFRANVFEGTFPAGDTGVDGYRGIAPVGSFPANQYGLFDLTGNVWEWCADWFRPYADFEGDVERNPTGPSTSYDPEEPDVPKRVIRGGSFLCSDQYCSRYQVGARGKCDPGTSTNHIGFRCVRSAEPQTTKRKKI
jgi:formylglycine-generating enzyme